MLMAIHQYYRLSTPKLGIEIHNDELWDFLVPPQHAEHGLLKLQKEKKN